MACGVIGIAVKRMGMGRHAVGPCTGRRIAGSLAVNEQFISTGMGIRDAAVVDGSCPKRIIAEGDEQMIAAPAADGQNAGAG